VTEADFIAKWVPWLERVRVRARDERRSLRSALLMAQADEAMTARERTLMLHIIDAYAPGDGGTVPA